MEVTTRKFDRSFLYSLLLHAAFLLAWGYFAISHPSTFTPPQEKFILVEVEPLKKASDSKTQDQVVQTEKGQAAKEAKPNAFLGERTQIVEKQVISMPKTGDAPKSSRGNAQTEKKQIAEKTPRPTEATQPVQPEGAVIHPTGALSKFGIAINANKEYTPPKPKKDIIEEASMTAQARGEYVKGFKEGEETMLNTKEFVFYGYFQRLRERLDKAWEKSLRDQLVKYFYRGRQLASETDYTTQLLVSLDDRGRVVRVQVVGASGTKDLDEAAIKAFNDAGPFPNPPTGLISNGQVQVRWDFVLRT